MLYNIFSFLAVLSIPTVKTHAVSSRRGDEVLKAHAPSAARRKQLLVLCIRTGLRPSRDTAFCFSPLSPSCFFSGFCLFLWLAVPWTSEQHTPPYTTATLFSRPLSCSFCLFCRQLAAANVLAVLGGCACLCSRPELSLTFPRLLVLRLGLNSHSHKPKKQNVYFLFMNPLGSTSEPQGTPR